jgi:hypothetical protein
VLCPFQVFRQLIPIVEKAQTVFARPQQALAKVAEVARPLLDKRAGIDKTWR